MAGTAVSALSYPGMFRSTQELNSTLRLCLDPTDKYIRNKKKKKKKGENKWRPREIALVKWGVSWLWTSRGTGSPSGDGQPRTAPDVASRAGW